jgi:hypothetical protein
MNARVYTAAAASSRASESGCIVIASVRSAMLQA